MSFSPGDTEIQKDLECLRRERLGLQLFLHESSPRNFCDDALDLRVYGGVWDAGQGEKLVKEIKEQLEFLQVYFSESVNLLTTELQISKTKYFCRTGDYYWLLWEQDYSDCFP